MRITHIAALAIAASLSATPTFAVPITWHVAGEVTTENLGTYFFPFQTKLGDPIAFDFTFDNQTACSVCEDTLRVYDGSLTSFGMTVGDTVLTLPLDGSSIRLRNDWSAPDGSFVDEAAFDMAGVSSSGILFYGDLVFQSTSPTAPVPGIDDVQLTNLMPPDQNLLADPTLSFFSFSAQSDDGGYDSFGGRFLTSSVASIPEPSTLALLVPGFFFAWLMRRRAARVTRI